MSEDNSETVKKWTQDQITKSQFFHKKLHEWKILEISKELDEIEGETLQWNLEEMGISQNAWNKIIHRGIKPILVFANPSVVSQKSNRLMYYRLLAMVSQKSMGKVKLSVNSFETKEDSIPQDKAKTICSHLNKIISLLVEVDKEITSEEFILWRGMGAGSQALGSWMNKKGNIAEVLIKTLVAQKLFESSFISKVIDLENNSEINLSDGRVVKFSSEPDIGFYHNSKITIAVEIKGGIDTAGVLERFGAALKSLQEASKENKNAITILLMDSVSLTKEVKARINSSSDINYFFTIDELIDNAEKRNEFFNLLKIVKT